MIPTAGRDGMTLMSIVDRNNNDDSHANPIGPQLLQSLGILGCNAKRGAVLLVRIDGGN